MGHLLTFWTKATFLLMTDRRLWPYCWIPAVGVFVVSTALLVLMIAGLLTGVFTLIQQGPFLEVATWLGFGVAALALLLLFVLLMGPITSAIFCLFNSRLMEQILKSLGKQPSNHSLGWRELLRTEAGKLMFLLPLTLLAIVAGWVPVVGPIFSVVIMGSVLLYNFVDYGLELDGLPVKERRAYFRRYWWNLAFAGIPLVMLSAVPILNIMLIPWALCLGGVFYQQLPKEP